MNADDTTRPAGAHDAEHRGLARRVWRLLYRAGVAWDRDDAMRLAAAVAMYTILSLSPLMVITIKVTAVVLGEQAAARQVEAFLGPVGAKAVEGMITARSSPGPGFWPRRSAP